MKIQRKLAVLLLLIVAVLFTATGVYAQVTNAVPPTPGTTPAPFDMTVVWNALVVAVVPLAIAGIKKLLPKIPSVLLPVGAALLGVLANWLLSEAGVLPHTSLALGALCGSAAVGLREIVDQTKQLVGGSSSGNTPTPPSPSGT